MKIPAHCYKPVTFVGHPSHALRDAAKWLEIDARFYRKERNTDGANALLHAARALRVVADGKTPAEAFEFPAQETAAPKVS